MNITIQVYIEYEKYSISNTSELSDVLIRSIKAILKDFVSKYVISKALIC